MDWSRTKTILILALILTNSILFFVLYGDRIGGSSNQLQGKVQLEEVLKLLESEQVRVTSDIPSQNLMMSDIRLAYETYEDENIIEILLGDTYTNIDGQFLTKDAEVRIVGTQELVYRPLNVLEGFVETDVDEATQIATSFLEELGLRNTSVALWNSMKQEDGTVIIEFRQIEEGYFVENAYMTIQIAGKEVTEMKRKWFGEIEIHESTKNIEPPAKALFRLLSEIDSSDTINRPVEIEAMDLGYRLISNILTINFQEGEPMPYWRFRTSTGEVIYIEAQTE
tara:strand:+ start:190 stop:1035 length:846 start_codon:yes stop_codon:yes gene_type:complete